MERCDFSSVFRIIINYLNEGKGMSQVDLLYDLFENFTESTGFTFDYGLTSRWINGYSSVSPKLIQYYAADNGVDLLISDLINKVFPNMIDVEMLSRDIYDLVMNDIPYNVRQYRMKPDAARIIGLAALNPGQMAPAVRTLYAHILSKYKNLD